MVLGSSDSSDYKISNDRVSKWIEKREIEKKKYNDKLLEERLIFYSDFYDLKNIINKNWEKFIPILKDKKRFNVFFDEVEQFRNTLAHGRTLTSSQENLLSGISSDLKNLATIYHNKNEMKEDYFIQITKVSDNLGNIWAENSRPIPTLRVGDQYEFIVEANDPKERPIKYELSYNKGKILNDQDSSTLSFEITNNHVGSHVTFIITAFTPNSEYENEAASVITAIVLPE